MGLPETGLPPEGVALEEVAGGTQDKELPALAVVLVGPVKGGLGLQEIPRLEVETAQLEVQFRTVGGGLEGLADFPEALLQGSSLRNAGRKGIVGGAAAEEEVESQARSAEEDIRRQRGVGGDKQEQGVAQAVEEGGDDQGGAQGLVSPGG